MFLLRAYLLILIVITFQNIPLEERVTFSFVRKDSYPCIFHNVFSLAELVFPVELSYALT